MQLIIAEKPSVARDLARVLGVPASGKEAFSDGARAITWCIGHLVELDEPASYDPRWKSWRMDTLPMLPDPFRLRPSPGTAARYAVVRKLLVDKRVTEVVNACDAGREGELIFRYLYELSGCRRPVRRLWISSLTDEAVRAGMAGLRPGASLDALADAARCRSEADWLVGLNATRAITVHRRRRGDGPLLSIGRVQTPTLAMLVERERQIRAFVPRQFHEVRGHFSTVKRPHGPAGERFEARFSFQGAHRLSSGEHAESIVRRDDEQGASGDADGPVVERVNARTVREPPPLLFDLTSLQRTANKRYGFSAARTLAIAQALYERHKVLTYPRTDSRHLTTDVAADLPRVVDGLRGVAELAGFADRILDEKWRLGRRFVDDARVSDHHAIIPTGRAPRPGALDHDEARVFDLVARRLLGAFFPDSEHAVTDVVVRVGTANEGAPVAAVAPVAPAASGTVANEPRILDELPPPPDRYHARGRVRLVAGWQEVAGIDPEASARRRQQAARARAREDSAGDDASDEAEDETTTLPRLVAGDRLDGEFGAISRSTRPPPRFTDAALLGAMESAGRALDDEALREAMKDSGLGTPATRAATLETLIDRGYVVRQGKLLVPTATGIDLIETLPVPALASPELTGTWEARLARIARGEERRDRFMADVRAWVTEIVASIRRSDAPPMRFEPRLGEAPPGYAPAAHDASARTAYSPRGPDAEAAPSPARPARSAPPGGHRGPRGPRPTKGRRARTDGSAPAISGTPRGRTRSGSPGRSPVRDTATPRSPVRAKPSTRPADRPAPEPRQGSGTVAGPADPAEPLGCPRCQLGHLVAGKRGWGCSRWREGCGYVVWFETAGRRLTPAMLADLVRRGKTRLASFRPEGGEARSGRLVLDVEGPGGARFVPASG